MSFGLPLSNMNAPAPTGCAPKSLPYFATAAGDTGAKLTWLSVSRIGANRVFILKTTVRAPLAVTLVTALESVAAHGECRAGSTIRLNENATACALQGVPSWNFTPLRSVTVSVLL